MGGSSSPINILRLMNFDAANGSPPRRASDIEGQSGSVVNNQKSWAIGFFMIFQRGVME